MNTLELKGDIIDLLALIKEKQQLSIVRNILLSFTQDKVEKDWWDTLPTEVQQQIEKALEETKDPSKLKPHHEVMKKYEKWLS